MANNIASMSAIMRYCKKTITACLVISAVTFPLFCHASQSPSKPSVVKITAISGFIDPWVLRKALLKLDAMPKGDAGCNSTGKDIADEDIESMTEKQRLVYERRLQRQHRRREISLRRCEIKRAATAKAYARALASLNKKWMPVLVNATKQGDPMAEVILRVCETAPMLDRHGIASDCSVSAEEQVLARTRLEAIGFKPALHNYLLTRRRDAMNEQSQSCGFGNTVIDRECQYRFANDRYARILSVMETGFLGAEESRLCQGNKDENPELDKLLKQCLYTEQLIRALAVLAPRFYTSPPDHQNYTALSLLRSMHQQPFEPSHETWPYDKLGAIQHDDHAGLSNADFQDTFYGKVYRKIVGINANMDADLRKDPRWAIFVLKRHNPRPRKLTGQLKFIGTYQGRLISNGTSSVVTMLFPGTSRGLIGRYMMIYGDGEKVELGTLSPCMALAENELLCQWRDKFGNGFLNMYFDNKAAHFRGLWSSDNMDRFPQRGPYPKEDMTLWDGTRQ